MALQKEQNKFDKEPPRRMNFVVVDDLRLGEGVSMHELFTYAEILWRWRSFKIQPRPFRLCR